MMITKTIYDEIDLAEELKQLVCEHPDVRITPDVKQVIMACNDIDLVHTTREINKGIVIHSAELVDEQWFLEHF